MSVKHFLVPQDRYQALLDVEEKYLSLQQQQHRAAEDGGGGGDKETEGETGVNQGRGQRSELSPEQPAAACTNLQKQSSAAVQCSPVSSPLQQKGEGAGAGGGGGGGWGKPSNLREGELSLLRPPGIPASRRAPLKKWLVWRQ